MTEYLTIINDLEKKRVTFVNDTYTKPTTRDTARWAAILNNDDASLSGLSNGRKSVRRRAHELSTRILREFGKEVLLLVLSLLDQQKLARLDKQTFAYALREWWNTVPHPGALTTVASEYLTAPSPRRAVSLGKQSSTEPVPNGQGASAAFGMLICPS
ncbi:hypothetical protein CUC08_Gglean002357 [Alternaria sp. MG1]|nr:hypothetical protein CUC08_Gglean002357 [Alternaria sp. MG1]